MAETKPTQAAKTSVTPDQTPAAPAPTAEATAPASDEKNTAPAAEVPAADVDAAATADADAVAGTTPAAAPAAAPNTSDPDADDIPDIDALESKRDALDKQLDALRAQEHELQTQWRDLDKQIASLRKNALADRLMGPITPITESNKEQLVADPGALPQPVEQPKPKRKRKPLFSRHATPTKKQREAAGEGIEKRNGAMREPKFVTFLHHTMSETTAAYAVLCLIAGVFMIPLFVSIAIQAGVDIAHGGVTGNLLVTVCVFAIESVLMLAVAAGFLILAVRMVLGEVAWRLRICEIMLVALVGVVLCHMIVFGISVQLIVYGLYLALLIALHSYWDPELALERANRRTSTESLHDMIFTSKDERTITPGKRSGKGYITLNFFNIFWIFTICSIVGLVVEEVVHVIGFHEWQDRAGMLWGPFSPIYGFGGTLMTIALNRFHNKPFWIIFLVSAVIGGAFEFFTSWFMQTAFGITAWDYSGTFLNIDGRTNFFFMCCWGLLGLIWVKFLLPIMLYVVKKIPWGWRYMLTTFCAIFMIFDGVATLATIDCWYLREAGVPETTAIEKFCAKHYDNEYMQNRFQTMTMNVDSTARSK